MATDSKLRTYTEDVTFLRKYTPVVELVSDNNSRIAIAGDYQARIMTSCSDLNRSYGWINYDLIARKEWRPHINPFGGEDRFWIGPEGGQFSIFFPKNSSFDLEDWQTPAPIDSEPFELIEQNKTKALFQKEMSLLNTSGTVFNVSVDRRIMILQKKEVLRNLGLSDVDGVSFVGFSSHNSMRNSGPNKWKKETGLLSIWSIGMFPAAPDKTVVIPCQQTPRVNTSYFNTIPDERISIRNRHVFFRGDGNYRSKIGITAKDATPFLGSYSKAQNLLTIVRYSLDATAEDYVNSLWKVQEHPYKGDVVNSYNDGLLSDELAALGPFYELESSSATKELAPGESIQHVHETYHFQGDEKTLNLICLALLGTDLETVQNQLV